ncbi:Foldase protein PrsA [Chitinispirillum alkaliphilum]|nr:Foldase protein PrsA [Chitinispirillum alkaliphilum]
MIRRSLFKNLSVISGTVFSILFLNSCSNEPESPVIARVGNAVLTLDDLKASMPPELSDQITREQNISYIRQWMDTELLYQEALKKRIHREEEIKERLERMKKNLLSAEMISRSTIRAQNNLLNESTILEYYENNRERFIREQDMVKFLEIVTYDLATAHEVRRTMNSENFVEIAEANSDELAYKHLDTLFLPLDNLPPIISRALRNMSDNSISRPIQTESGFHILNLVGHYEKDEISTFEEVKDNIIDYLSNKKQKQEAERMLSELRLKTNVEFNFDLIPGTNKKIQE